VLAEAELRSPFDPEAEHAAVASYLNDWTLGHLRELREIGGLHAELQVLRPERALLQRHRRDLDYVLSSATWRLREHVLRLPGLQPLYRGLRRMTRRES